MAYEQVLERPEQRIGETLQREVETGAVAREHLPEEWQRPVRAMAKERLTAKSLGWLSIGLGAAEILFPREISRWLVSRDHPLLFRALGARQVAVGVGLLSGRKPAGWLWSRVAGDVVDLSVLGALSLTRRAKAKRIAAASAAVAAMTAVDVVAAVRQSGGKSVHVRQSVTTIVSPEVAYQFLRDLRNLPRFMRHVESVQPMGEKQLHWVVEGPGRTKLEWDAELTEDWPNRLIAWKTLPGATMRSAGKVEFLPAPDGRGTVVSVEMDYDLPGSPLTASLARLFQRKPAQRLHEDLRRFKQLLETGEIITTEGQPAGRPSSTSWRYDVTIRDERKPVVM